MTTIPPLFPLRRPPPSNIPPKFLLLLSPRCQASLILIHEGPYETVVARWRSRVAARSSPPPSPIHQILPAPPGLTHKPVFFILPRQLIPIGRPYRTQADRVLKMLTAKKSVRSLPAIRLASRYPSDFSSSDSPLRYSSSGYAISDSLDDSSTATSVRLSRKRCRSPTSSVLAVFPVRRALFPVRANLSPPPKRIRDSDSMTDVEADIDECIAYADAIRARGMDERDIVETTAEEEVREDVLDHVTVDGVVEVTCETLGGSVQRFHDHIVKIPVHQIQVIESKQRLQGHRITGVDLEVTTMKERIIALEQDNTRIKGMLDVES
nr:hypothetical protein [Tanacetum cinerariifolium]